MCTLLRGDGGSRGSFESLRVALKLALPEVNTVFDALFHAVGGGFIVAAAFGEVGLGGEVSFVVV